MKYDLVVIGAGPGGYVCALRAAQLGLKVAVVEKKKAGGTCLNVGCIPSKALLDSTEIFSEISPGNEHGIEVSKANINWSTLQSRREKIVTQLTGGVEFLLKKAKVDYYQGFADVKSCYTVVVGRNNLATKNVVLATGSTPVEIPFLPFDGEHVISSTEALNQSNIPKSLIVVGGGYIGLEMASVYSRIGTHVTVIEMMDRIVPLMDTDISKQLQKSLRKQGIKFKTSTKVTDCKKAKNKIILNLEKNKKTSTQEADQVLVAVGRRPNAGGINLNALGVTMDERGFVSVNQNMETSIPGIYAIGDLVPGPMLAHKASEEGVVVAERIAGKQTTLDYSLIPSVVYTHPEGASIGRTADELKKANVEFKTGMFPFSASGRAMAIGCTEGFVKVLADSKTDKVLGVHILGPKASELISEAAMVMGFCGTAEDIGVFIHAHPTLSEALKEAALEASGHGAIHT